MAEKINIDIDIDEKGMIHFANHDLDYTYCGHMTEKTLKTLESYEEFKVFLKKNNKVCCYSCTLAAFRKEAGVFIDGAWSFCTNGWPATAVFPEGHFEKSEIIL